MTSKQVLALRWLLAVVTLLAAGFFVMHEGRAVLFPFPIDYGEGPLLEQGRLLASGHGIYHQPTTYPFTVANYPPIFPALLAIVWKVAGPSYTAARLLVAIAALTCAALIAAVVRAITGERYAALIAGGLFLACPWVSFWSALVRVDFVALALSLGSLVVIARRPQWRWAPYVAAGLLVLACLTRQSHVLAGPVAAWIALRGARLRFLATFLVGCAVAVGVLDRATGGAFLWNTVSANVNAFVWDHLRRRMFELLMTTGPALVLVGVYVLRPPDRLRHPLVTGYLLGAGASTLTIGKVGSHVNYFLEISAALAIAVGVCLASWRERRTVVLTVAGWAVLLFCFSVFRPESIESRFTHRQDLEELASVLRAEHGEILADDAMGMLVLTGHPLLLQPFEMSQLAAAGRWDDATTALDVQNQRFSLILINETEPTWMADRWTPRLLGAIHGSYSRASVIGDITLFRPEPKDSKPSPR